MANVAWGIDIGNRALKAVKLSRTSDGIAVTDYAFIEHDTILSESGDNRDELIRTSLAKFVGRHDTRKVPVCVGVSGQQSFARFVKLPPVEPKKVPEIVRFEAVQQIPFPLDEVEWSYQLFPRDDDPDLEVGIFAMRKELVNDHVSRFVEVDLDVHAVQTNPLSVYNALRHDGRLDKGHAVIVDLGADSTDLIIGDNDGIWMRSLDIGGNNFTEALARQFKIDFAKAEEMKRTAKTSKYAKQIYQAMRPVFGELVSEIQRSLGFFGSTHRDVNLRKVIALGGGFKLNGLSGFVQKNLKMPVEKPTKFGVVPPEQAEAVSATSEHMLSSMAAYGQALQLLGESKVSSSLLPTHIRQDKMWRDKTKYFAAAGGLVVGAVLVAFGGLLVQQINLRANESVAREVDEIISRAQQLDSQWTEVTGDGSAELRQVKNVNALVQGRDLWGRLLADVFASLPQPPENAAELPRDQRGYVRVDRIESVYAAQLDQVINSPNFGTEAEALLNRGPGAPVRQPAGGGFGGGDDFGDFGDAGMGTTQAARGFVIRLTLTTPLPYEQAIETLANDNHAGGIVQRLVNDIHPDTDRPDLPYEVTVGNTRVIRAIQDNPDMVARMRQAYEARQLLEGVDERQSALNGQAPRPGGFAPQRGQRGGFGGEFGAAPGRTGTRQGRGTTAGQVDPEDPAFLDPVTNESRLRDTEIQVVIAVMLDPPPYQEEPELPGEDDGFMAGLD